ncbi:unnamed protein product [Mytilus coruscus]|uniref:Novel STAND NTPase 3 domain-containing protein n=1 Tax=Mytilus coruscus TaxID=42192 RepID=A0A6J8ADW3_MYTCO|nr:unnamed protein product [Mytilus coruscus]
MRTNRKITQCMLLGFFHQCIIIMFIITDVLTVDLPRFKCPEPSQWKFRAASKCNDTEKYICLFDENEQKDSEFCGSWPDFENPGYKQILLGGTTREPCSDDRFQPFTFWTNGSSKCVYKKTHCNQEGQVIYNNGTLQTNRICRCDYTNNYDFVLKPRNGCFCVPSEEDCSCYVKTCPTGYRLTRDYECLKESKLKFNCPEIYKDSNDEQVKTTTILSSDEHETSADSVAWSAVIVTFVCINAILVLFFVYCLRKKRNNFGVLSKSRNVLHVEYIHSKPEKKRDLLTGINGFNKNETTCMIPYDVLDLQEKEILKWRKSHVHFEETTASKTVLDKIKTHGFVILSGPPGSGKSAIAYNTAFILEKDEEFKILPVSSPDEIRKYLLPETKQVFLIDDPVGKYTVDDLSIQRWKNEESFLTQTFTGSSTTNLILTCRSYIYKFGFCRRLHVSPIHCDMLSDNLKLSVEERKKIGHMYNIPELNDDIIMMYDFVPLLCVGFSRQDYTTSCFVNPIKILSEEMNNTKEKSDIAFLAIALLVVRDNNIDKQILNLENPEIKELLNDLCNECGFKYFPSTTVLMSALYDLIGTYVKETDNGYVCIHDNLFQILSYIVGSGIIHCLLKYGSSSFLSNRLQLASIQEKHDELVIMVKLENEELYFDRLLSDIRKGFHSTVFTGIQMEYSQFRLKLLTFFFKRLKAEDLTCDEYNSTPLHVISEQGYDDFLFQLFQLKKDQINYQDKNKRTPLFMACLGGHDKVIQTLITFDKSSLNIANDQDLTPLDAAWENGYLSTVTLLLAKGANVNRKDKHLNRTALQRACESKSTEVVRLLLNQKLDVTNEDIHGKKAIHIACERGPSDIVELLLKHKKEMINDCDAHGRTPIFIACEKNQQNIVDLLLRYNANVNQPYKKHITPLHQACQIGNEYIVGALLNKSAKVNVQTEDGFSPLYIACLKGYLDVVEILLNQKADINLVTKHGLTPFFISCSENHLKICKVLLDNGANINKGDKSALTPLHVACREGHEGIVRFLLENFATVNAVNSQNESPLHIGCMNKSCEIVELLLKHNADVNLCDKKGNSPLHVACLKGNTQIIQLLRDKKSRYNH